MSNSPIALSVIVVNFNAGALLSRCVGAVLESFAAVEIYVSDNGSSDQSLAQLRDRYGQDPRLHILENRANLGFARANNLALEQTRAPFLLFLNPDCIVQPNTLHRMIRFMEDRPQAGMAGCVIRNPDGTEQVASRRTIPDPWVALVRFLYLDRIWPDLVGGKRLNRTDEPLPEKPIAVEAISGSFMLVRREALASVGPLDEGYFLHCEDLDWFVRFRQGGWQIYLVPDAEVVHYKGFCSLRRPIAVEWHKHRGMVRFFRKFQSQRHSMPFRLLVMLGIWAHFLAVLIPQSLRQLKQGGKA